MQLNSSNSTLSLMFSLAELRNLQVDKHNDLTISCDRHAIIAFSSGEGMYRIADTKWRFKAGTCILLPPGSEMEWHAGESEIEGYMVSFDVFGWGDRAPLPIVDKQWPYYRPLIASPASRLLEPIKRLRPLSAQASQAGKMRQLIWLQEIICLLLELNEQAIKLSSADESDRLRLTVGYLNEHYLDQVTVDQLAQMADMGRSKYSLAFQLAMGKKPLEYLNDLRIEKAKQLLEGNEQPLREIARQVGFNDEYYFNRRFTKRIGIPPGLYAKLSRTPAAEIGTVPSTVLPSARTKRIVVTGYTLGELLILGIKPVGAELTVIGRQVVFGDLLHGVADVGLLGDPAIIEELRPDIIILGSKLHRHHEKLGLIAPTAILDSNQKTYARLFAVAELLGMSDKALEWIEGYERRWQSMWASSASGIRPGETASVVLLHMGKLYVMGMSGFAASLYHPQGFKASISALDIHASGDAFRKIEVDNLSDLEGDRLFLLADPREINNKHMLWLMDHPKWRTLEAVQQGRYHIADSSWNFDDPVTRDRLLYAMPSILRFRSDMCDNASSFSVARVALEHAK
ncbi:helix-turn-helix domain-containing protein [Paenibacillus sp. 2TAB23]|uniref:helix-turn-helix domain-containing protein n=1 Tax=Paenibacillus sp. 2TAB23 TaxID=3233004 RepID=UPI003F97385F